MKKIAVFILLVVMGVILVPSVVSADVREVGGFNYSKANIDYSIEGNDYIYMYGILSPSKYIVFNEDTYDFYYFENGTYREVDPTPAEVIKSRDVMWYDGDETDYYYDADYKIMKSGYHFTDNSTRFCFDYSSDLTAQEGITYYVDAIGTNDYTPVFDFDVNNAHNYYKQVDCDDDEEVSALTEAQIAIFQNLVASTTAENRVNYGDKFNFNFRYFVIKVGDNFVNVFLTSYTNEDVVPNEQTEFENIYKFYDIEGNELANLDNYIYMIYMEKSNFIIAHDYSNMYVLDSNFNVIFERENLYMDWYYLFDIDDNRLLIDHEDGEAELITRYVVLEGQDQTFNDDDLSVRISGELSLLDKVFVNDEELPADNYSTSEGSTVITLKKAYLYTLRNGTYTLRATYTDGGVARATFIVNGISNPATNDNILNVLLIGIISLIASMHLLIIINKKKFS